ncbi:MAG: NUDIX hydrolase [Vampirovibrionales bacterium]|nr:NUDIX hydrolase [Vampirovibrionales bacterium]
MGQPSAKIRVRVAVVLQLPPQGKLVLLRQNNKPFWVLPGGTLEFGETLAECAQRELMEELGLSITPGRLLAISEYLEQGRHVLDIFMQAHWREGTLPQSPPYPENINEVALVDLPELSHYAIQPSQVVSPLIQTLQQHGTLAHWQASYIHSLEI